MNCRKVSQFLSAYIDGELPGVEHRQVREHLAYCAECAHEHDSLLQTKRMLSGMRVQESRPELAAETLRRIEAGEEQTPLSHMARLRQGTRTLGRPRVVTQRFAFGAAAALMAVVLTARWTDTNANNEKVVWYPNTASTARPLPPAGTLPADAPSATPLQTWPQIRDVSLPFNFSGENAPFFQNPAPGAGKFRNFGPSGLPQWPH